MAPILDEMGAIYEICKIGQRRCKLLAGDIRRNGTDKLLKFSEDLTDICILGALWSLCSLPIVTVGAASTAMYEVFMQHIIHGKGELVKPFFAAFKENFKGATILWLIMLPLMVLFTVDAFYYLYLPRSNIFFHTMGTVMFCLLAIVILLSCYVFSMMALYSNTVKDTLIKSIQYFYISWPWTLLIFAVNLAIVALLAMGLWYFLFLFAGISGYVNSRIVIKAFKRDIPGGSGQKK
jgi:uncharacterized membrane protein YesL